MKKIIIIDYNQKALLDFIQIAYRKKYKILKTTIKEEDDRVHIQISAGKNLKWEYEDSKGNVYLDMSSGS